MAHDKVKVWKLERMGFTTVNSRPSFFRNEIKGNELNVLMEWGKAHRGEITWTGSYDYPMRKRIIGSNFGIKDK